MNVAVELPNSLGANIERYTKLEGVSINNFILSAIAEKISAIETEETLIQSRAKRGSREHGLSILSRASDVKPVDGDVVL